ncbi:hypothetical protein HOLleu_21694 [Holothuria leucospilota]|uniref:Ig-like domain-containing protein n=1 Tax=Holothuria leucospilota TaxID=206669 RepID=A0A9Q1BYB0_HOLLE|nr:hypothetical protein HOLleu_21694 [Holothuria leucospilota]
MSASSITLQLFLLTTSIVSDAMSVVICAGSSNVQDEVMCEVSNTEYVCLVCPVASNETGIIWKDENNKVIFRENVRTDKEHISFAINNCDQDNYTLSFTSTEFKDKKSFVCLVGDKSLSKFIVQLKDLEDSSQVHCKQFYENDRKLLCGIFANSSVCLVCPISRGTPGIAWKHKHNTLFQNDVSIGRRGSSLTVNNCDSNNYTLSFGNLTNEEQGIYSCYVTEKKLTEFFVYDKDAPSVKIFRGGKIVQNPITVNNNETTLFTCIATNVTLPAKVFWDVDNRQIYTENKARKLRCGVEIHLNFLPNRAKHTVSCVYKGPIFDEIRTNITLYSTNNTEEGPLIPVFLQTILVFGLVLGIMAVALLCGLFKFKGRD